MNDSEYDMAYAQRQLARSRSIVRKLVKRFYLDNILKDVQGPAIDFGCGAGQLLERLPAGSLGLELNPNLVELLQARGFNVERYEFASDGFQFANVLPGYYKSFVMCHVLEHFDGAAGVLKDILASCKRLDIRRIIVVVPGPKGYLLDKTHKTFVDVAYLAGAGLLDPESFAVSSVSYFPLNRALFGRYLTYHELKIVYDRR